MKYGFQALTADDVVQDVFIQLTKTDIGVVALDGMRSAEAWLRKTARFMAQNSIDRQLGSKKDAKGRRVGRVDVTDFYGPRHGTDDGRPYLDSLEFASMLGIPEAVVDDIEFAQLRDMVEKTVLGIVDKVQDPDQREALVGFYLRDQAQDATTKARRRRACASLTSEEVSSLQVWRMFAFPDSRRPSTVGKAPPTPLIEAVTELGLVPSTLVIDTKSQKGGKTMKVRMTHTWPFHSPGSVNLAVLDLENEEGDAYSIVITKETQAILKPGIEYGEYRDIPDFVLLPYQLGDA
jgi:DNA-directed RNA polymerase specialized sigma24 family protein